MEGLPVDSELENTVDFDDFYCTFDVSVFGKSNILYSLDLTESQKVQLQTLRKQGTLIPGWSRLQLSRATLDGDSIEFPGLEDISKALLQEQSKFAEEPYFHRKLAESSEKPVLLVHVTDGNGHSLYVTPEKMANKVFGTIDDNINLSSQMTACSLGQYNIVPGPTVDSNGKEVGATDQSGNHVPGVIKVTIDVAVNGNDDKAATNAITAQVEKVLGFELPGPYAHAMYVLPDFCDSAACIAARGQANHWMSFYYGFNFASAYVQTHEIGHNLNLGHSGGLDGNPTTDDTCQMGYAHTD
ncbi:MAG: hypothetical protein SGARI_006857, partial [Bacillariaceae sp.]